MKKYSLFIFIVPFLIQCSTKADLDRDNQISRQIEPKIQPFIIDQSKDTLIRCDKGTLVHFNANSFVLENGAVPEGVIEIEIQEYYSTKDLISRDLVTMSDTSLLVSGGMIDVTAWAGSEMCYLKMDHPFTIFFPKEEEVNANMKLFYTEVGEDVNWKLNPENVFDPEQGNVVPYDVDVLLECGLEWDGIGGFGYVGHKEDAVLPDLSEFYKYKNENFVFTSEMKKYFCENHDEYIGVSVDLDEDARVISAEIYGESTPFDAYVITFFDTITQSFDPNGPFNPMSSFFSFSSTTEPSSDDFLYSFNEKYAEFRNAAMTKVDNAELNYYVMNSISFGLINCDYFSDNTGEKVDFVVKSDLKEDTKVYLVFEEARGMMLESEFRNSGYVFENIPIGKNVKIVAINSGEEQPKLAIEYAIVNSEGVNLSSFKTFTLEELDRELENL
ncbi:MAG: hypothetical protein ACI8ZM_002917 [Crocinitomix sp.]|jgi:hypothetical protein